MPSCDDKRHRLAYTFGVKVFRWDPRKNEQLKAGRGVSFEDVVLAIETGGLFGHCGTSQFHSLSKPRCICRGHEFLCVSRAPHRGSGVRVSEDDYSQSQGNPQVWTERKTMKALDLYEKQVLSAFKAGKLKSTVTSEASLRRYREYERATLSKNKRVNIRLSTPDLSEIQARAAEEGIPYQTLIASVLHRFVAGRFIEK